MVPGGMTTLLYAEYTFMCRCQERIALGSFQLSGHLRHIRKGLVLPPRGIEPLTHGFSGDE